MLALTHLPAPAMQHGERTHIDRSPIDFQLAVRQHADYCRLLEQCGATVRTLNVNLSLPDCAFIEDAAVVLDEIAVLAAMGAASRRSESAAIELELRRYRKIAKIELPAMLEGGDVLRVGRTLLVGSSSRTNLLGIRALESLVQRFGYHVLPVTVRNCLHLKTACCALPDG